LIAGGINSENIQTVNQLKLSHQGYDLASGIEVNGRKDIEKMTAIVNFRVNASCYQVRYVFYVLQNSPVICLTGTTIRH
jgi:hypothetical protein